MFFLYGSHLLLPLFRLQHAVGAPLQLVRNLKTVYIVEFLLVKKCFFFFQIQICQIFRFDSLLLKLKIWYPENNFRLGKIENWPYTSLRPIKLKGYSHEILKELERIWPKLLNSNKKIKFLKIPIFFTFN